MCLPHLTESERYGGAALIDIHVFGALGIVELTAMLRDRTTELSWKRRNATNLSEISFLEKFMEKFWDLLFQLMKHGTNTLHVAFIFLQWWKKYSIVILE
jgi:hypothetical protein